MMQSQPPRRFISRQDFGLELRAFVKGLPEERKEEVRAALYKWSDERAKKPAKN